MRISGWLRTVLQAHIYLKLRKDQQIRDLNYKG
jgi:hypothetical protein